MTSAGKQGGPAAPAPDPGVTSEVLVQSYRAWNGAVYPAYPATRPQLTVVRMTVPAYSTLPWHLHAAPNAGYVLAGSLTLEDRRSGQTRTFVSGEAFTEEMGLAHRGVTGDGACTVILTYAGTPDMPTSTPAPA